MARVVVMGAGPMGLAAAYHAAKAGHAVVVLEAAPEPGGMAAHFDFDGLSIERFYHFVCKDDRDTFALLDELGLGDRMRWRPTTMGYFIDGRLYEWGNPLALLRFPAISLLSRLRYGLLAFLAARPGPWPALESQSAGEWIRRWGGHEAYARLWKPLFDQKFHDYADNISAAWVRTRIRRVGRSRRSVMQEELGYIEGGSQTLVEGLCEAIRGLGGEIRLAAPVTRVIAEQNRAEGHRVVGVATRDGTLPADAVISTIPIPLIPGLVPDLPPDWKARYAAIKSIGVCCAVFKLKKAVTPHFWVNIADPEITVPGIVEFSNLRPLPDAVVFVPYYMPTTHPKFAWTDRQLLDEAFGFLTKINPTLGPDDILAAYVGRLRQAQPVCEPGFAARIPPIETPIANLQIADTCFYYPEDRGISESVRLSREMAARLPR